MNAPHIPVLLNEVVDAMQPAQGKTLVDGTFGAGGYSRAILVLLTNSPRDHRRRRDTQSKSNREHQRQHRLCQPHRCNRVRTQAAHPEHVHHSEQRL